jgi:transposase-like protein
MKKRNWSSKEKFKIVLEGIRDEANLAEVCNRHQITQSQFYRWRDKLLAEGDKLFVRGGMDKEQERLRAENKKLKGIIGELTVELKKSDY